MTYFWLDKQLSRWNESLQSDRKPQAVILNGPAGMGKQELLNQIIADLLCRKSTPACGQCQNCVLNRQGYHPDVDRLIPENNLIKVKMIRELTQFFVSTPHCSDHKIAVIKDAHQMNSASSNALLKVLEEPPSRGLLFLLTDSKHQLLPTIRSRCISLDVTINNQDKAQLPEWLKNQGKWSEEAIADALMLSDWRPLTAKDFLANDEINPFKAQLNLISQAINGECSVPEVAKKLCETQSMAVWMLLQNYWSQLIKSELNQTSTFCGFSHPLNQTVKNKPKVLHILVKFTDLINMIMLNFNTQVKTQLMVESVLIDLKNELSLRS